MTGKKKVLHNDDVKVVNVTQCKGLRVLQIHLFTRLKIDIDSYLPELIIQRNLIAVYKKTENVSRIYFSNGEKSTQRDAKESNIVIQAQSKFASIFRKSEAVSTTKGKLDFDMRPSKPPKTT